MKTCKTCKYGIYNPATDTRVCINSDVKHGIVGDEFDCGLWEKELDKEQ